MPQLQKDHQQPDNLDDTSTPATTVTRTYNRLRYRAIQGGVAAKARAMFFYQGESENGNAQAHANGFAGLHADWQTDYPALQHIYEVQVRVGCGVTYSDVALRQTQRSFGDTYAHTSVMATNGLTAHEGCHYRFIDGYEKLGLYHFGEVSRDLYGAPAGPNIDALNPATAEFTDATRTQIRVTMRDPRATINFPTGALDDFALVGTSATISSRTVAGNAFTLQLSGSASGSVTLEYRGHAGGGAFVTNGSGLGLLSFSEPVGPISPLPPAVTLVSPASPQQANVGDTINVVATAADGTNGAATRMVFRVNGVPKYEVAGNSLNTTWQVPANGAHLLEVIAFDATNNFGRATISVFAGPSASPGGVSGGLQIWLKAETGVIKDANGFVAAWRDQSGNNNHAIQAMSANQPKFANNAFGIGGGVQFDGNDHLTSSADMPTGSYTKIVRFKAIGTANNHNLISSDVGGTPAARDHAFFLPNLTPTIFHTGSTVSANQQIGSGAAVVAAGTFDTAGNAANVYVDGVLRGSGSLAGPNTIASYQLGAFAASNFLVGSLAEVIVYDHVLSAADRTAVFNYLDDKYRTPFGLWLRSYYGPSGSPTADVPNDGLIAAVEYGLGLDPTQNNSGTTRLPAVVRSGNTVGVSYQRATDHPDAFVELQFSADLLTWTTVSDASVGVAGNVDTRRYTATVPPVTNAGFFRLRISVPQ